jgi:hypothetical protein
MSGESGSAATLAPASVGADAHADDESAAGVGDERGLSLEEKAAEGTEPSAVREALAGALASLRRQELSVLLEVVGMTRRIGLLNRAL